MKDDKTPYIKFGQKLKSLRVKAKESVSELGGAIEVDIKTIEDIEAGITQPAEDLVHLITLHFKLADDEAEKFWSLAGYDRKESISKNFSGIIDDIPYGPPQVMFAMNDTRVIYTDVVQVSANQYGVIIDFMQGAIGPNGKPASISKLGMSEEHAKSLIKILAKTLQAIKNERPPKKNDKDSK